MPDNVLINEGVSTSIATDLIAGSHYQRVKQTWGPDGTANDVDTATGKPLPAQLRDSDGTDVALSGKLGIITETAPATDTASSGLNGRLQRIAQRITSLIALLPTSLGANGGLKIEGVSSGTVVPVTATNLSSNVAQLAGTTTDTNSGSKSAGTLRVVLATDQPALTNKLLVTPDANSAVNVAQINGVTTLMGNGATGTGSQRVTIASDNTVLPAVGAGATAAAVPANAAYDGGVATTSLPSAATAGNLTGKMVDKYGRQVQIPVTIRDLVGTQTTTISASTSETTIVTAAASVFNDIVMLIVSNTSAATNTRIDFRDDTAGTILFSLQSNGGQPPVGFALPVPVPQTAVNKNWTAQCATSTTDIRIYAVFAKNR